MKYITALLLTVLLITGSSCATPGTGQAASPSAIIKQTLVLAETTATAANYIAITLSQSGKLSIEREKDVQSTTRAVDAAVHIGLAALDRGDVLGAQAQVAAMSSDLSTLSSFITTNSGGKP